MDIPKEKLVFAKREDRVSDEVLKTKPRSYLADAMLRFTKNKSSVAAAWILLFLVIFVILSPVISPYSINDKDNVYRAFPSFVPALAHLGLCDGGKIYDSQNEISLTALRGIAEETGMDPFIKVLNENSQTGRFRGSEVKRETYDIKVNDYYALGIVYRVFSYEEFERIQKWQNETGIQVIFPYVLPRDIEGIKSNPNLWYKVDPNGRAVLNEDGSFIPVYATDKEEEGAPYDSIRIPSDDGSYIYSAKKSGSVQCRICYYNYYRYHWGHEPLYIMGTSSMGMDLFGAIGVGGRFSLVFAVLVAVINLFIGTIYGSLQGYYGGAVDMILDRILDVLSGVPFIIVATLFQMHLAARVGVAGSFLFAFVLTGWVSIAALTRMQFYRFRGMEFVMASHTLGASDARVMYKHILPNAAGTIITGCALLIPGIISSETALSYLGIVDLSSFSGTTLGSLLSQGSALVMTAPHTILWPSIFIGLLMISFNLLGNGLRDAFNPATKGGE